MTELTASPVSNVPKGRVLVVDDDEAIVDSIEELLDAEFAVRTAPGVQAALALLDAEAVDVVLTDFQLLDGTGDQVVRHAAGEGRGAFPILLTGHMDDERVVALGKTNSALVLGKPIEPDVLIDWVRHGLALARLAAATRPASPATPG